MRTFSRLKKDGTPQWEIAQNGIIVTERFHTFEIEIPILLLRDVKVTGYNISPQVSHQHPWGGIMNCTA